MKSFIGRITVFALLLALASPAAADRREHNRVIFQPHKGGVGLQIPYSDGAPSPVAGQGVADVVVDYTNKVLYLCNGSSCVAVGSAAITQPAQYVSTYDPTNGTAAKASILVDVSGHEANDKAFCLTTDTWCVDKEGDQLCTTSTCTGAVQGATVTGTTSITAPVGGLILGAVAVDADADEIDKLDGLATTKAELATLNLSPLGVHTVGVGADAGTTIDLAIQFNNAAGAVMAVPTSALVYLADDASGLVLATASSGGWAIQGGDGLLMPITAGVFGLLTTSATGSATIRITEAGAHAARYLVIVLPTQKRFISGAITFT